MKIKLSKAQWEQIGKTAGWIDTKLDEAVIRISKGESQEQVLKDLNITDPNVIGQLKLKLDVNRGFRPYKNPDPTKDFSRYDSFYGKNASRSSLIEEAFWRISRGENRETVMKLMGIRDPQMVAQLDFLLNKHKVTKNENFPKAFQM